MKTVICVLFVASCAAIVVPSMTSAAQTLDTEYQVYVISPAVNNQAILGGHPRPEVCKAQTRMHVSACRGEYEPVSFLVETTTPLTKVDVKVGPITGEAGQ